MRNCFLALAVVAVGLTTARSGAASDLMCGSWSRPACGKVCKLVCETATLTAVGYGCECDTICIPGPSRPGCKHCYRTCCCDSQPKCCPPKIEFCWRDWFACGCAQPRTVKVLTKFQAEKEICWYHWEVVDAACCGCDIPCGAACNEGNSLPVDQLAAHDPMPSRSPIRTTSHDGNGQQAPGPVGVYKSAPPDSQIGDEFALNDDERSQLTNWMTRQLDKDARSPRAIQRESDHDAQQPDTAVQPAAASEPADESAWHSLGRLIRLGD